MSTSSMKTLPEVGLSSPPIMLKRVDLPEPDGPIREMYSPRRMSRLTPLSACSTSWPITYSLTRSFVRTMYSRAVSTRTCSGAIAILFLLDLHPQRRRRGELAGADCRKDGRQHGEHGAGDHAPDE